MSVIKGVARKVWKLATGFVRWTQKPGGINDEAMPSGYIVPYKKGSRQVRNLTHIDF